MRSNFLNTGANFKSQKSFTYVTQKSQKQNIFIDFPEFSSSEFLSKEVSLSEMLSSVITFCKTLSHFSLSTNNRLLLRLRIVAGCRL